MGLMGHRSYPHEAQKNAQNGIKITQEAERPVVAFDFDGTLTCTDSLNALLKWQAGHVGFAFAGIRLIPALLAYAVRPDRGALKAALLRDLWRGRPLDQIEAEAEAFADVAFDRLIRLDALAAWQRWQQEPVTLGIVTASPALTVAPFARRLGADFLIGSELAQNADGAVTGLDGPNCRGEEKVRRLEALFGPDFTLLAAYGDTGGDREMLARAREGHYRLFRG